MSVFERTLQDEMIRLDDRERLELKVLAQMDAESGGDPGYVIYTPNLSMSIGASEQELRPVLRRLQLLGEIEPYGTAAFTIRLAGSRRYADFIRQSSAGEATRVVELLRDLRTAARVLPLKERADLLVKADDAEHALTTPSARQQAAGAMDAVIKVGAVAQAAPAVVDVIGKLQHSHNLLFP
jgi:hypothetical protein